MRILSVAITLFFLGLTTVSAQDNDNAPPAPVPVTTGLGELLDDGYEVKAAVLGNVLILQKKKSVYACPMSAQTLADVTEWDESGCVDVSE